MIVTNPGDWTQVVALAFHHLQEEAHCLGAVLIENASELGVLEHSVRFVDEVELYFVYKFVGNKFESNNLC
jgi:hypothetical protein